MEGLRVLASLILMIGHTRGGGHAWIKAAPDDTSNVDRVTCSQMDLPCSIIADPNCEMASTWPSSPNGHGLPGPPLHLALATHVLPGDESYRSWSGVNVSWSMPENDSVQHVTGFELQFQKRNTANEVTCQVFNLSQASWSAQDFSRQFFLDDLALSGSSKDRDPGWYSIRVRSLPIGVPLNRTALLTIPYKPWDRGLGYTNGPENAAFWTPDVVVFNDSCSRTVTTSFALAPAEYDFRSYTVAIVKEEWSPPVDHQVYNVTSNSDFANVTFYNVSDYSWYSVRISAVNSDKGSCVCTCNIGTNCHGNCQSCLDTFSQNFSITTVPVESCTTHGSSFLYDSQSGLDTGQWVGVLVGLTTGVLAIVVVVILLRRVRRRKAKAIDQAPIAKEKTRVYIWFSDDTTQYATVIGHLIRFLRHVGNCDVVSDLELGTLVPDKAEWVLQEMKRADKIILVLSPAVTTKMAMLANKGFPSTEDSDGFILGCRAWLKLSELNERNNWLIALRLGASDSCSPFGLNTSANLQLMTDADKLLLSLRDAPLSDRSVVEMASGQHLRCNTSEEGVQLREAIRQLEAFQASRDASSLDDASVGMANAALDTSFYLQEDIVDDQYQSEMLSPNELSLQAEDLCLLAATRTPVRCSWIPPDTYSESEFDASEHERVLNTTSLSTWRNRLLCRRNSSDGIDRHRLALA